ncbi:MAG: hypothetical protein ACRD1F_01530 [Terriglobales bacterium]
MRRQLLLIVLAASACLAQSGRPPGMSYAVENPPQPQIEVRQIRGKAIDRMNMAIPLVQLGLYTAAGPHKLLAIAATGEHGKFDFGHELPPGKYRLIVRYPGLCTANIPVDLSRHGSGKKIALHMVFPGLGGCSYAVLR